MRLVGIVFRIRRFFEKLYQQKTGNGARINGLVCIVFRIRKSLEKLYQQKTENCTRIKKLRVNRNESRVDTGKSRFFIKCIEINKIKNRLAKGDKEFLKYENRLLLFGCNSFIADILRCM